MLFDISHQETKYEQGYNEGYHCTDQQAAPAKAEAKKPVAKKTELKSEISVQFGGKSYSQEELLKIAKDVWKYDLKQKAADLTSVELYVKPEENMVYYVMNKEITGSFYI